MPKLNQIIAVEKTTNSQVTSDWKRLHKDLGAKAAFEGRIRTYEPLDPDHGERFPDEEQIVQLRAEDILQETATVVIRLLDVVATKDWGNTEARADIVLSDGRVLVEKVPVTYLLFLEKRFIELHNFVSDLPVVDPSKRWEFSSGSNLNENVTQNIKTKKIPRQTLVWVPPTPEYKQDPKYENWQEDVLVGYWNVTNFSGAVQAQRKQELLDRVRELQVAVKQAREEANSITVTDRKVGKVLLDYILAR